MTIRTCGGLLALAAGMALPISKVSGEVAASFDVPERESGYLLDAGTCGLVLAVHGGEITIVERRLGTLE